MTCEERRELQERDGITMAKDANCPNCDRVSLIHTGAFWLCPRCGLMITKHALAAEIMRAGREDYPGEEGSNADRVTGPATD
jgi:ribosomal protein L37AE/L43A